jgi:hypothetical protein
MSIKKLFISAAVLSLSATFALAQTPVDPATASEKNPNPASSSSADDEGGNPLSRPGEHSPTGWNADMDAATIGQGPKPSGKPIENKDRTVIVAPPEE